MGSHFALSFALADLLGFDALGGLALGVAVYLKVLLLEEVDKVCTFEVVLGLGGLVFVFLAVLFLVFAVHTQVLLEVLEADAAGGQVVDQVVHERAHRISWKVHQLHKVIIIHIDAVLLHIRADTRVDIRRWLEKLLHIDLF